MLEVTQKVLEIDPVSFQPVIKVTIKIPVSSTMDAHLQGLITHEQIGKELCEKIAAAQLVAPVTPPEGKIMKLKVQE